MTQLEGTQIEVSRTFEASLDLLWKAWTEAEHFKNWYGPKGFTIPTCEIDLQVGGRHLWNMRSPDGNDMFFTGTFQEITPMDRLVFTDSPSDAEGNAMGMGEGMPASMEVTVAFAHTAGKTTVTISHMAYGPGSEYASMGWEQALEKLEGVLA